MPLDINTYLTTKAQLARFKKLELEQRAELLDTYFGEGNIGTLKTIAGSYLIKGSYGVAVKLDEYMLASDLGDLPEHVRACIQSKTSLIAKNYKELSDEDSCLLDEFITAKPSLPTLTIKEIE